MTLKKLRSIGDGEKVRYNSSARNAVPSVLAIVLKPSKYYLSPGVETNFFVHFVH